MTYFHMGTIIGVPIFTLEIGFNDAKITFYDPQIVFLTQIILHYTFQPFLTKRKIVMSLIFCDLSFEK